MEGTCQEVVKDARGTRKKCRDRAVILVGSSFSLSLSLSLIFFGSFLTYYTYRHLYYTIAATKSVSISMLPDDKDRNMVRRPRYIFSLVCVYFTRIIERYGEKDKELESERIKTKGKRVSRNR